MASFLAVVRFNVGQLLRVPMLWVLAGLMVLAATGGAAAAHFAAPTPAAAVTLRNDSALPVDAAGVTRSLGRVGLPTDLVRLEAPTGARPWIAVGGGPAGATVTFGHGDDGAAVSGELRTWALGYVHDLQAGTPPAASAPVRVVEDASGLRALSARYVSYAVFAITYLFALLCGSLITTSVASERVSRVSEMLSHRVSSLTLIYGKVAALAVVLGLTTGLLALDAGVLVRLGWVEPGALASALAALDLSPAEWGLAVASVALGVGVYTALYAVAGVLVRDESELQFAQLPVTVVLLLSFVSSLLVLSGTGGDALRYLTLALPTASPLVLADTVLTRAVPLPYVAGSLGLGLGFLALVNWLMARVFVPRHT